MEDRCYVAALMALPAREEHDLSMRAAVQSEEVQEKLHKLSRHVSAVWRNLQCWARSLSVQQAVLLLDIWNRDACKALLGKRYYIVAERHRRMRGKPKRRSSRRLAVQMKRKLITAKSASGVLSE